MKKYVTPVTEIIGMDNSSTLCGSIQRGYEISDDSGNNPYQNPDWYDEGDIEDDDGTLNSQGKEWGDLWGDFGF